MPHYVPFHVCRHCLPKYFLQKLAPTVLPAKSSCEPRIFDKIKNDTCLFSLLSFYKQRFAVEFQSMFIQLFIYLGLLLSCQPRVPVTLCFVDKVIRGL